MMFTIRGIPTAGIAVGTAFVLQRRASAAATAAARPTRGRGRAVPCGAGACEGGAVRTWRKARLVFAAHLESGRRPMLAGLVGREGLDGKSTCPRGRGGEHVEEVCACRGARRRLPSTGRTYECAGRSRSRVRRPPSVVGPEPDPNRPYRTVTGPVPVRSGYRVPVPGYGYGFRDRVTGTGTGPVPGPYR